MKILLTLIILIPSLSWADGHFVGRYCELDGVYTNDGEYVTGSCYMWSNDYGELDGAYTIDGEYVSGECYRYSDNFADVTGYTSNGTYVTGDCYFW